MVIVEKNGDHAIFMTSPAPFVHQFSKYMKTINNKNYSRTSGYKSQTSTVTVFMEHSANNIYKHVVNTYKQTFITRLNIMANVRISLKKTVGRVGAMRTNTRPERQANQAGEGRGSAGESMQSRCSWNDLAPSRN